jgi:hypothetical protein
MYGGSVGVVVGGLACAASPRDELVGVVKGGTQVLMAFSTATTANVAGRSPCSSGILGGAVQRVGC